MNGFVPQEPPTSAGTLDWGTMSCRDAGLDDHALQYPQVNCVPPRSGTHLRAWRPRWASVRWWVWLGSSCPRPWRPSTKRRHLGGGDGSHSLAQSFIPRAVATGPSAQGRPPGSQNGAKRGAHAAGRGDGRHRRERSSLGCPDFSSPVQTAGP